MPFMPLHPTKYAVEMLSKKKTQDADVKSMVNQHWLTTGGSELETE
jgi:ATP-dependent phosphoenolpyruvate carboxykinase